MHRILRIVKTMRKTREAIDNIRHIDDVMQDLEQKYEMEDFSKDTHCRLMDKCEGEAYDTIKGLQGKPGSDVYITIYRWFT